MSKANIIWNSIFQFIVMVIKLIRFLPDVCKSNRDLHQNEFENVLILGNGPSLQDTDVERLVKETSQIICVNFFPAKDERFFEIKPKYLCLLDPSFFYDDSPQLKEQLKMFYDAIEKVDWNLNIVCAWGNVLPVDNKNISYIYLNRIRYQSRFLRRYLYSHNLATPGYQNVIIGAIYFAINGGADKIFLAGVDNSEFKNYIVDENNRVYCEIKHHYGGNYRMICDDVKVGEFYKKIGQYYSMFEQYHLIADYAKQSTTTKIINVNPNSYVDVFEKTSDYYYSNTQ